MIHVRIASCLGCICCIAMATTALAYRPFVSTDAAVAETGKSEVEVGIVDYENHRGQNTVSVPDIRYNFGVAHDWELVAEGALQVFDSTSRRDVQLLDPRFGLKTVLLDGPLQEGRAPMSLGVELSALFPETLPKSRFGFEGALLTSWRVGEFTFHANAGGGVQRESNEPVTFWGVIVERPIARELRAAVEANGLSARRSTADNSVLLGLLWEHDGITYDAGVRFGFTRVAPDVAFTAGFTFRF